MSRPADPALRGKLIDAARAIFAEKGFAKASISDIAGRAGVAHGTIYLYFKSKDAIAAAISNELSQEVLQLVMQMLSKPDLNDGIRVAVQQFFELCAVEHDAIHLLFVAIGMETLQRVEEESPEDSQDLQTQTITVLQQQMEAGLIRNYEDAVSLLMLVLGLFTWSAIHGFSGTGMNNDALYRLQNTLVQMLSNVLIP